MVCVWLTVNVALPRSATAPARSSGCQRKVGGGGGASAALHIELGGPSSTAVPPRTLAACATHSQHMVVVSKLQDSIIDIHCTASAPGKSGMTWGASKSGLQSPVVWLTLGAVIGALLTTAGSSVFTLQSE